MVLLCAVEFGSLLLALLERCCVWRVVARVAVVGLVNRSRRRAGG